MNIEINQKISQFLDGELDHTELEHFLSKMKQNPDLQKTMARYQLTGHVLRSDNISLVDESFLQNINNEIKQQPHHFLPKQKIVKKRQLAMWHKTSVAIAASFALVAVIISQQSGVETIPTTQLIAQTPVTEIKAKTKVIQPNKVIVVAKQPSQHERLKAYLQAHSDDLYTHGSVNYQPHARVASFGRE